MKYFKELDRILRIAKKMEGLGEAREEARVPYDGIDFPIMSFHFGSTKKDAPTLVFVAGVHGLEKIGTQILISFLDSWIALLKWDKTLQGMLKTTRILFYPLVNPVGMYRNTRSNGNGVDLMRNGAVEARGKTLPLVGGHRVSPKIPWYRGENGLEFEGEALCDYIRRECFNSSTSLVLDIHSGFGLTDSLWLPYAGSNDYFREAPRVLAIKKLLDRSYPHHVYKIEPQHHSYQTHGDLWDQLLDEFAEGEHKGHFIPLCLEIGSWMWVRKNPRQLMSSLGLFNPILPHRVKRAERRHFLLLSFLLKIIASPEAWDKLSEERFASLENAARGMWYSHR